ncbi:MAG: hypothetical protein F4010_05215 [Cenarchaeum sp. SB0669_bin_11]|nr:hypothetical protein [Gammaproteobacteria bacterium]MYL11533.1 hypothetical protein [Cenarchaeum sp. SB0669_bin_11]
MQEEAFRRGVKHNARIKTDQPDGTLADSSVETYVRDALRAEEHYGDLDVLYDYDRFRFFFKDDARRVSIHYEASRNGCKTAVRHYRDFKRYSRSDRFPGSEQR